MKVLEEKFTVQLLRIWGQSVEDAHINTRTELAEYRPDVMLLLGDRFEILAAATAAHLLRIPIAHIGGGDVTEGSYDDAMRDCISRMSHIHFVTSTSALARLSHMGYRNVHLVGNPGIDYIRNAPWKAPRPFVEPYVVISYQSETIDSPDLLGVFQQFRTDKKRVWIRPNPDRGSDDINALINIHKGPEDIVYDFLPHADFLNLIAHCDEFIGNSSSMLYEAPELGIKTRMIGKRQKGRVVPWGDGNASLRIAKTLAYTLP
jgi:UDP-N-acetylglucosamine 2-epimerase (non-hydrolysing)/GDP/UDP-N,N'-diacetylbacillosamine 2-epimerase (hydrolysing)